MRVGFVFLFSRLNTNIAMIWFCTTCCIIWIRTWRRRSENLHGKHFGLLNSAGAISYRSPRRRPWLMATSVCLRAPPPGLDPVPVGTAALAIWSLLLQIAVALFPNPPSLPRASSMLLYTWLLPQKRLCTMTILWSKLTQTLVNFGHPLSRQVNLRNSTVNQCAIFVLVRKVIFWIVTTPDVVGRNDRVQIF